MSTHRSTSLALALALAACAALGACSLLAPSFEAPRLAVERITLGRSDLITQHLDVRMRVENPNERALPVKSLEYTLYIANEQAAQGISDASFTVPARGEAEFDVRVTANMAGALLNLLLRGADSQAQGIDYRIVGRVELSSGFLRSIPFERRGTFNLR
jgi:LEA14-like dessication related protein